MRLTNYIIAVTGVLFAAGYSFRPDQKSPVLICYGKLNADKIRSYQYVILESELYSDFEVKLLNKQNELTIAYLSVGEVSANRAYFKELEGRTLGKNDIWDSHYLDLADAKTQEVLFAQVEEIVAKGFQGLFLDTVDAFGQWGPSKDQSEAFISFLAALKARFPSLHLMQNSGYTLLSQTSPYINSIAIESIFTDYNFKKSKYRFRDEVSKQERVDILNKINAQYDFPIIVIEYANTQKMKKKLQTKIADRKWQFFIGQIELEGLPQFK